jgi:hypothetical protein
VLPHQEVLHQRGSLSESSEEEDTVGEGLGPWELYRTRHGLDWLHGELLHCTWGDHGEEVSKAHD